MPSKKDTLSLEERLDAFGEFLRKQLPEDAERQMHFADSILPPERAYVRGTSPDVSLEEVRYRFEIYFFTEILKLSRESPAVRRWFAPQSLKEEAVLRAEVMVSVAISSEKKSGEKKLIEHWLFEDMFRTAKRLLKWEG